MSGFMGHLIYIAVTDSICKWKIKVIDVIDWKSDCKLGKWVGSWCFFFTILINCLYVMWLSVNT